MKIQKKAETQQQERKYYGGLETFKIIAVNPTTSEINKLYDREDSDDDKEQEYVDTTQNGDDRVRITFFLRGMQSHRIARTSFYIADKERVNSDGDKHQYINQVLQSGWGASEDDLMNFFKEFQDKNKNVLGKKTYRKAKEGECDFYDFIRGVMRGVDYYNVDTDIQFDYKKMLKGNFKELQTWLLDEEYTKPFCAINYIRNVDGEGGEVKTYNEIYSRAILPSEFYGKYEAMTSKYYKKMLDGIISNPEELKRLNIQGDVTTLTVNDIYGYVAPPVVVFKNTWESKMWSKFKENIDGDYGCKGWYKISPLFEYHPSMDITAGNAPISSIDPHDNSY